MKKVLWFEGWMDLKTGEININLTSFHCKEEKKIFLQITKELKKSWKKSFKRIKKMIEEKEKTFHKIKLNFYDEEVPGRNDYWIHSEQQKGYNE